MELAEIMQANVVVASYWCHEPICDDTWIYAITAASPASCVGPNVCCIVSATADTVTDDFVVEKAFY